MPPASLDGWQAITTIARVSQHPPQYPQPPYFQPQFDFSQYYPVGSADLLAPARRAAILQGVLGALVLMCGVFIGGVAWKADLPVDEIVSTSGMTVPQLPEGVTLERMLRIAYTVIGGCGAFTGVLLLVLCFFVRRGTIGPIVTSIIFESAVILVLVLNVVGALVQMAANPAIGLVSLILAGVPLAAFGLNVLWLIAAARNGPRLRIAQQQFQAQFYQYQQQQPAYGSAWPQSTQYGGAAPWSAPATTPSSPTPSPSSSPAPAPPPPGEQRGDTAGPPSA
jgi:hypothetical protein